MFIREKIFYQYPVFATPGIKIWSKHITGYTGATAGGLFEDENGVTGCTMYNDNNDKTFVVGGGIPPENVIHGFDFFAQIPEDTLDYYGSTPGDPFPAPKKMVFGAIVLPTKYRGLSFDNCITDDDGNLKYRFVKGNIPESIKQFIQSGVDRSCTPYYFYNRYYPEMSGYIGITAGVTLADVSEFSVFYSDAANVATLNKKAELVYSLDKRVEIPQGYWNSSKDNGCAPCVVRGRNICYTRGPRECGGIPYGEFQTVPETIQILSLNLAICERETGEKYITITDTNNAGSFSIKKAIITSNGSCSSEIPCGDDLTRFTDTCTTYRGFPALYDALLQSCDPNYGIGKGYSLTKSCSLYPVVDCGAGGCSQVSCDTCTSQEYIVEVVYVEDVYEGDVCADFPGNSECTCKWRQNTVSARGDITIYTAEQYAQIGPDPRCGTTAPGGTNEPNYKSYRKYSCETYALSVPRCESSKNFTIRIKETYDSYQYIGEGEDCKAVPIFEDNSYDYTLSLTNYTCGNARDNAGLYCCCCGSDDPRCAPYTTPPDLGNVAVIKETNTTVYEPNPYVMYTNDSLYFDFNKSKGISGPNFSKYIQHYFHVWANHRIALYPEVISYKAYFKNPQCSLVIPDYFFFKYGSPLETGGEFEYDEENTCNIRKLKLPNWDTPCRAQYHVTDIFNWNCRKNINHNINLEDISFKLACGNSYDSDVCWKGIQKYYKMYDVEYYGKCKGEGVTLTIQMPIGLTLTDCTNVLSWDVLSNAPKKPI
jgi:hypothetical protein